MGPEPVDDGAVEIMEGAHHGDEGLDGEVLDVFDAGRDGGVGRERED